MYNEFKGGDYGNTASKPTVESTPVNYQSRGEHQDDALLAMLYDPLQEIDYDFGTVSCEEVEECSDMTSSASSSKETRSKVSKVMVCYVRLCVA